MVRKPCLDPPDQSVDSPGTRHAQELPDDAAAQEAQLAGRLLLTRYNGWLYVFDSVSGDLTIDSRMPADRPGHKGPVSTALRLLRATQAAGAAASAPVRSRAGDGTGSVSQSAAAAQTAVQRDGCSDTEQAPRPEASGPAKQQAGAGQELPPTFREYYEGKWTVKVLDPDRRMLAAHRVGGARHRVYLAPQLCVVYPLSLATVRAAQCVPCLLWWLLGLLRAAELRAKLAPPVLPPSLVPSARAVFEALTCKACEEPFSYERMETMGDAVLKFSTGLHLFDVHATEHEGQLAGRKDAIISNAILAALGERLGLPLYLTAPYKDRAVLTAAPAGPRVTKVARRCTLRRKALADVVEALIGSFFESGDERAALAFIKHVDAIPGAADFEGVESLPGWEPAAPGSALRRRSAIEAALDYTFRRPELLREAVTHCSWPDAANACYQRLEVGYSRSLNTRSLPCCVRRQAHSLCTPPGDGGDSWWASLWCRLLASCARFIMPAAVCSVESKCAQPVRVACRSSWATRCWTC